MKRMKPGYGARDLKTPFGRLFEANVLGLVLSKSDGSIFEANQAFLDIVGYTRAEMESGKLNWRDITPPEDPIQFAREIEQLKRTGVTTPLEKEYLRRDGTRTPVLTGSARLDDDPNVDSITYVLDLSASKVIQQELRNAEDRMEKYVQLRTKELMQTSSFLDSLIENLPNMMFVKDAKDLKFLRFNRAGEELLGMQREELIGKSDYDFFPKAEADAFREHDLAVLEGKSVIDIPEEPVSTRKQGLRYLHTKKIPVLDSQGQPIYLLGIAEDITNRKYAEEERFRLVRETLARMEAEKAAERLSFMSEASAVLGSSLDFEATLKNLSNLSVPRVADWCAIHFLQPDGTLQLLSIAHANVEKTRWATEISKKYPSDSSSLSGAARVIRDRKSTLIPRVTEETIKHFAKDEEHLRLLKEAEPYSYICAPIRARGQILGTISLITTTESKRVYSEVDRSMADDLAERAGYAVDNARLYKEAQNLNRVKDEFLATLSHELRTPLNVIQGYAELLQIDGDHMSAEEVKAAYQAIYRNAQSQTQIIGDLLDVSSIVTGKINFKPERLAPAEVATAVFESASPVAESRGIQLSVDASKAPRTIYADPTRLQQILWNLVSNALKFTPTGGRVDIRIFEDGTDCVFEISDNGKGIEEGFLPHVFERFRQEDGGTTRKFGGLGLGLSIVRHLTELHGGSVNVESPGRGKGSKFTIRLPAQHAAAAQLSVPEQITPTATREADERIRLDGVKVLLLEDSADSRDLFRRYLTGAGAEVTEAESVREAREILGHYKPDIILSDIGMPEEDGVSFIRRYRDLEKRTGLFTPAIALTAYVRPDERDQMLNAGFQAHVSKPVSQMRLLKQIAELTHPH